MKLLFILIPMMAFGSINDNFHAAYDQAKIKAVESLGPIIIAQGDKLVLHYKGERSEVIYIPAEYHRLKIISHIPVLIHVMLSQGESIASIQKEIEPLRGDPVIDVCLEFDPENFYTKVSPLLLENAAEAAFLQLEGLHNQIQKWKKEIPAEDWNRLAAIVIGPQMPRIGEVTMQYFSRLTGTNLETGHLTYDWLSLWKNDDVKPSKKERRLIYAENMKTEEEAISLLATHIIDEQIGLAFFGDNARMTCDLLAEGAAKRLAETCEH